MELFKLIKMNLAMCLYFPNQAHIFNKKRFLAIIVAFLLVVSHFIFLFYEANSATEHLSSAYMTVGTFGIFVSLIDTTFKTNTVFILIDVAIKEIIRRSELKRI